MQDLLEILVGFGVLQNDICPMHELQPIWCILVELKALYQASMHLELFQMNREVIEAAINYCYMIFAEKKKIVAR